MSMTARTLSERRWVGSTLICDYSMRNVVLVLVEPVSLDQLARYLTFQTDSQSHLAPSLDFSDVRQVTEHTTKLIDLAKLVKQYGLISLPRQRLPYRYRISSFIFDGRLIW